MGNTYDTPVANLNGITNNADNCHQILSEICLTTKSPIFSAEKEGNFNLNATPTTHKVGHSK